MKDFLDRKFVPFQNNRTFPEPLYKEGHPLKTLYAERTTEVDGETWTSLDS